MRTRAALVAFAFVAVAAEAQQPSQQQPANDPNAFLRGSTAWWLYCMSCHEPAKSGAPDRADVAKMTPDEIYKAMTDSPARHPPTDTPRQDIRDAANYIGRK